MLACFTLLLLSTMLSISCDGLFLHFTFLAQLLLVYARHSCSLILCFVFVLQICKCMQFLCNWKGYFWVLRSQSIHLVHLFRMRRMKNDIIPIKIMTSAFCWNHMKRKIDVLYVHFHLHSIYVWSVLFFVPLSFASRARALHNHFVVSTRGK